MNCASASATWPMMRNLNPIAAHRTPSKISFGDFLNDALEKAFSTRRRSKRQYGDQKAIDSHRDLMERFGYNTKRLRGEDKAAAKTLNLRRPVILARKPRTKVS